jgi:geranylgeranyl pyrophosphate synthase
MGSLAIFFFQVSEIGYIVQMLHNASLLIDDIEDSSMLRRGIPVAHKVKQKRFIIFNYIVGEVIILPD